MMERRHDAYARYLEPGGKKLGLTTKDEQAWCRWYGAEGYAGRGAIVEWGAWLGSLTSSYCEGLRSNSRRPDSGTVAYAYDLFRWEPWCEDEVRNTEHAGRLQIGESFADYFRAMHASYRAFLEVRPADLTREKWHDGPIELIVNDAVKTLAIGKGAYESFLPSLLPEGLLANQDYLWPTDSFIAVLQYLLRHSFTHEYTVPDSCMVIFRCHTQPDPSALAALPDRLCEIDPALLDEAFSWSRRTVTCVPSEMIDLGKAVTLWQAERRDAAKRVVRDARLATKRGHPVYDFQLDVLGQWGYGDLLA